MSLFGSQNSSTGSCSTVGIVSDCRYMSDCRSGVESLIPAQSHTFTEIDHEIISTTILLPSADSRIQEKVCARSTGYCLVKLAQEKVWLGKLTVPT